MKILVIGAQGMLGQELVKTFANKKNEVVAWDFKELDITDAKQVQEKIGKLAPELILNAAAYNAVDNCEKNKEEYALAKKLNGMAPGYLAKVAKKIGATLVHYSTDYVFNGMPELPEPEGCAHSCSSCSLHEGFVPLLGFKEDAIPEPLQKYGRSKLLGEENVQKYGERYYIIRLSKLFGAPAKSKTAKKSFFEVMLEIGKKKEKEVHPVKSGKAGARQSEQFNGVKAVDEETSAFTYAPDLAKKTKEIVETQLPYGIYHVVNDGYGTWYDATVELYRLAKLKTEVVPVGGEEFPRPALRPYVSTLLNTKLVPMRHYKLALREYLKNIK